MRAIVLVFAALAIPSGVMAQEAPPTGLDAVEMARSSACVDILTRLDDLDQKLQPLALQTQRFRAIGQAIAIEDRSVVDSLNMSNPAEAAVRAWFDADLVLALEFVETRDDAITAQRSTAREEVLATLTAALAAVQVEARAHIDASGDLATESAPCDGAILVRPVVVEACQTGTGPVCDAVAATEPEGRYRFVDSPADLWDVSVFRPWTDPGPLQVAPDGQVVGARTLGYARQGNVVVTAAFGPLLQQKADITAEQAALLGGVLDSLGMDFSHPDIVFAPSLGIRVTLPEPLAGETFYMLHFGAPQEADIVWTGPAGTGAVIDATVAIGSDIAAALASGLALSFTAVAEGEDGGNVPVFSIQFTNVNQGPAIGSLLNYMSGQLSVDLATLVPPGGGGGT
ncbi:MAG: hypothetical protein KAJ42_10715 [Gemmatimonadetes bacterium]|nr:hypothetical protein [Gemmatimonadota bacterium]